MPNTLHYDNYYLLFLWHFCTCIQYIEAWIVYKLTHLTILLNKQYVTMCYTFEVSCQRRVKQSGAYMNICILITLKTLVPYTATTFQVIFNNNKIENLKSSFIIT